MHIQLKSRPRPVPHRQAKPAGNSRRSHFLVWKSYQGRVDTLQGMLHQQVHYLGWRLPGRGLRGIEYLAKAVQSLARVQREEPQELWVQVPPTPLVYVAAAVRRLLKRDIRLVADCHSGTFRAPWRRTPWMVRLLNRSFLVVVHNATGAEEALAAGIKPERCRILEDPPAIPLESPSVRLLDASVSRRPKVLFPAGFGEDEPLEEVLAAARALPQFEFFITGDQRLGRNRLPHDSLPANVQATGWLEPSKFKSMLANADVVVGLTSWEGVQLSSAGEALGYGKAMVLSSTATLRQLYPQGAIFTSNDRVSLARSIHRAVEGRQRLEEESVLLQAERLARCSAQMERVQAWFDPSADPTQGLGRIRAWPQMPSRENCKGDL